MRTTITILALAGCTAVGCGGDDRSGSSAGVRIVGGGAAASGGAAVAPVSPASTPPASAEGSPPAVAVADGNGSCANIDVPIAAETLRTGYAAVLCLHNAERAARKLPALKADPLLARAATAFARRMVDERFFDHTGPDGSTPQSRIVATGWMRKRKRGWAVAENIANAMGEDATARALVARLMDSPEHRANILDPRFRRVGIGLAAGVPDGPETDAATLVAKFGSR